MDDLDRVLDKIEVGEDCWEWRGARLPNGYGQQRRGFRSTLAHRIIYELLVGPIPEGLEIDHLCRNKLCVNPDHLEAVTRQENHRRMIKVVFGERTTCLHGHPWDEDNNYVNPRGSRMCRVCTRERMRKRRVQT